MGDKIKELLNRIPMVNPKADFESFWQQLTGIQVEILKYVNGITPVGIIFNTLPVTSDKAAVELENLLDADIVRWADEAPKPAHDENPKEPITDEPTQPVNPDWEMFDSLPDDFDMEGSDISAGDENVFDDVLNDFFEGEAPEPEMAEIIKPSQPLTGSRTMRTRRISVDQGKFITLPGFQIPAFLMDVGKKQLTRTFKFAISGRSCVVDFFKGDLIKVESRPVDPRTFLGIALARYSGLRQDDLETAVAFAQKENMMIGEALSTLRIISLSKLVDMLSIQTANRLAPFVKAQEVALRVFTGRVDTLPGVRFSWQASVFNAGWKRIDDEALLKWGRDHRRCIIEKTEQINPATYGLGMEVAYLWKTKIGKAQPIEELTPLDENEPDLDLRALNCFFTLGLARLIDPDGRQIQVGANYEEDVMAQPAQAMADIGALNIRSSSSRESSPAPKKAEAPKEVAAPQPDEKVLPEQSPEEDEQARKATQKQNLETKKQIALDKKQEQEKENLKDAAKNEFDLGMDFFEKRDWGQANNHFRQAASIETDNPVYDAYMAFTKLADTKNKEIVSSTLTYLRKAREEVPDSADLFFLYALTYKIDEQEEKASIYFQKTLQINPNHREAEREMRLINQKHRKAKKGIFSRALSKMDGKN